MFHSSTLFRTSGASGEERAFFDDSSEEELPLGSANVSNVLLDEYVPESIVAFGRGVEC
jgi:hypothetical protein